MKSFLLLPTVLSLLDTAAAWSSTNYWQTSLITSGKTASTTSISVLPTGTDTATASTSSTTTFTSGGLTILLTVYDLFYRPSAAVCTPSRVLTPCGPTPTLSRVTATTITTTYWAPVHLANPTSCTKTSFDYTTASTVALPSQWIPDIAQQATQSVEALLVTTYVKTLSINMGGQAVTTSVCDVYLRTDAVLAVIYTAESSLLRECVDPRDYACNQLTSALAQGAGVVGTKTTCERSGQTYPPVAAAAGGGSGSGSGSGSGNGGAGATGTAGAASPTKSSAAGAVGVPRAVVGGVMGVVGWGVLAWI